MQLALVNLSASVLNVYIMEGGTVRFLGGTLVVIPWSILQMAYILELIEIYTVY